MVLYILGYILKFESAFLMLPALVSLLYQERAGIPFVITAAICLVLGIVFTHKKPSSSTVYTREGFVTVALSWIVMSIFGAIPFVWNGDIPYYVDALFETVSGFTTTGSSILSDVESLSHASLFWRSFSHWIGGMGVFVFIMSILPLMGGSTINLMKAESPGPSIIEWNAVFYFYLSVKGNLFHGAEKTLFCKVIWFSKSSSVVPNPEMN